MKRLVLLITLFFCSVITFSQTISAEDAKNYVGKTVTVLGKVADGRLISTTGKQPTILNIDKAYPNQIFSIVIYGENRKAFGYKPEEALLNKNVFVTGKVSLYKGKPQIEVTNPEQIVVASGGSKIENIGKEDKSISTNDIAIKSTLKLRSGPGTSYKSITKLKAGSVVKVLQTDNGWSYVSVRRNMGKKDEDFALVGFIKTDELK